MKRIIPLFVCIVAFLGCSHKDPDPVPPQPPPPIPAPLPPAPVPDPAKPAHPITVIQSDNGKQYYTGLIHKKDDEQNVLSRSYVQFAAGDCEDLPAEFDLRTLGLVDDVRDQGSCGSCWAFSMTGSLASAMRGIGKILDLSEQEIVSCDRSNDGCGGGNMNGFSYQISHGQGLEVDFPYRASDVRCKAISPAAKGISYQYVGSASRGPTEKELKCALVKFKTVPWITVSADGDWGSPPSSENTLWTRCGSGQTNHAVGVVGFKKFANGKTGFIMKNSWGTDWGDNGYATLPLGCDSFGDEVGFIQVQQPAPPPPPPPPPPTPVPPPSPCDIHVKLPAEVQFIAGNPVSLMNGFPSQAGVTYSWYIDGVVIAGATDTMYTFIPTKDAVYKLQGKTSCGAADSQTRVRQVMSK